MNYFKICPAFQEIVMLFFTEFNVCTQNAGYLSDYFTKGKSINQGCNISPYIYLLCSEILAHKLMENKKIKGVTIADVHMLLAQFADDTILFLTYDAETLNSVVDVLQCIEANIGLRVSYEKTTVYRIGSLKGSNAKIYTTAPLAWSDQDVELLGVLMNRAKYLVSVL